MPRLIWSPPSRRDLIGIDAYLNAHNALAATRILRAIRATALRLPDHPRIGRPLAEPFRLLGVRATPYVLIYRLQEGDIEIVRIRHTSENWWPGPEAMP